MLFCAENTGIGHSKNELVLVRLGTKLCTIFRLGVWAARTGERRPTSSSAVAGGQDERNRSIEANMFFSLNRMLGELPLSSKRKLKPDASP